MMAFVLAETKDSETGWYSDSTKAGLMAVVSAETKDFENL